MAKINHSSSGIRNFVFGVEDGLASTVGLLSGLAATGIGAGYIILTGVVLIFVEAFSMGIGSILSEDAATEYEVRRDVPLRKSFRDGVVMFFSYFVAGFIPLSPYFFGSGSEALRLSIILSIIALVVLGVFSARVSQTSVSKNVFKTVLLGGVAIAVGMVVGNSMEKILALLI